MVRILLALVVIAALYYFNPLTNMKSTAINETNKQSIDYIVKDVVNTVDTAKEREKQAIEEVQNQQK